MTDDSYFNISQMKLSITSLYIISDDIIWTEKSYVIDSFISEILKYKSSVIESLTEKPLVVLLTSEYSEYSILRLMCKAADGGYCCKLSFNTLLPPNLAC